MRGVGTLAEKERGVRLPASASAERLMVIGGWSSEFRSFNTVVRPILS